MCEETKKNDENGVETSALELSLGSDPLGSFKPRREDIEIVNLSYEREQLGCRIRKLSDAIKADPTAVSDHHKDLWKKQLSDMKGYYHTLGERIKDLVDTSEK